MQGGRKTSYRSTIGDVVFHSLTANTQNFGSIVTALFISFYEGQIFSRWIVTKITSARGTLYSRKTRIPCGDQLVICGLYLGVQNGDGKNYVTSVSNGCLRYQRPHCYCMLVIQQRSVTH
jgi:hypothetical protein